MLGGEARGSRRRSRTIPPPPRTRRLRHAVLLASLLALLAAAVCSAASEEAPATPASPGGVDFEIAAGRVSVSDGRFSADDLRVVLGGTELRGRLSGVTSGGRPSLEAVLESPQLRLGDLGIEPGAGQAPSRPASEGAAEGGVARGAALELPDLDARVSVRLARVTGRGGFLLEDVEAELALRERVLSLERFAGSFEGGALGVQGRLDAARTPHELSLDLNATGVRLAVVTAQLNEEPLFTGLLDLWLELSSRGGTLPEMRSGLTGDAAAMVRGGAAPARYLRAFERDLFRVLALKQGQQELEPLECLIADFRIDEGVARAETLWLETASFELLGRGTIDLGGDAFDLRLVPRFKRRALLSVVPEVQVSGPLAAPRLDPVKRTLATSAVNGLFSSLAQTSDPLLRAFWRRQGGAQGPCAEAFSGER